MGEIRLQPHLLCNVGWNNLFVNHNIYGFCFEVSLAYIEETMIELVGVPTVLNLEVLVAFLVNSLAHDDHAVVVGGLFVVEHLLTLFRGYPLLFYRALDVPKLGLTVLVAELRPTCHVGTLCIGNILLDGQDSITIAPLEAFLAHVRAPSDAVAVVDGIVGNLEQLVDGYVLIAGPQPVVGHLKDEGLIVGVGRNSSSL